MALTTSRVSIRGDFEPLPGSVYHATYPYCDRAAGGPHDPGACTGDWEAQLDALFAQVVAPSNVAAFVVEPVLGEGGYMVPSANFLPRLRAIASRHGIPLAQTKSRLGSGARASYSLSGT